MLVSSREAYRGILPSCAGHASFRVGSCWRKSGGGRDGKQRDARECGGGRDINSEGSIACANEMRCTFVYTYRHLGLCIIALISAYSIRRLSLEILPRLN